MERFDFTFPRHEGHACLKAYSAINGVALIDSSRMVGTLPQPRFCPDTVIQALSALQIE